MAQPPKRVLMLLAAPFPTRQGTQVYVRHQAEALAKAGVDLHLVTYRDGQGEYRPDYELSRAFSPLRSTRSGPSFGKPFADLSLFATAARILKKRNHDVIWAHHIEALAIGLLLKKLFSIPLVFQAHTDLAEELPLYYQQSFVKSQARRVAEIFEKSTYPRADCVVVFDRAHADKIQSLGVSKSKIETIAAALNFGHWPSPSGVQKDLRVLYAGNPDEYQNLSLFWKAAKIISKKRPDVSFEVLTHHLPSSFSPELCQQRLGSKIQFTHLKSEADFFDAHHRATVGVSPRIMEAGVPIKILNYLASGLRVIAASESVASYLQNSVGEVVSANPEEFAEAILRALKKGRLSEKQVQTFRLKYEMLGQASEFIKIIDNRV